MPYPEGAAMIRRFAFIIAAPIAAALFGFLAGLAMIALAACPSWQAIKVAFRK